MDTVQTAARGLHKAGVLDDVTMRDFDALNLPILYSFKRCPYAMRARMALVVSGVQVQLREVSLNNKPAQLLACSPKATVPVLVTASGVVIDQSRDIMLWALQQADPDDWLCNSDVSLQQQMTALVDECDNEFKPQLDRYKYCERYPELPQAAHRAQAEVFLQQLETRLAAQAFLVDDRMRFADAAIFPFVRQFAGVDKAWFAQCPYHNVRRWLHACTATPLFAAVMHTYAPWREGDAVLVFVQQAEPLQLIE